MSQKYFAARACRLILTIMMAVGLAVNGLMKSLVNIAIVAMSENTFNWNEHEKQNIIGIFFWGFAFTKIPSGRLSEIMGPRKVIGYSMLLASFLTILTPTISYWNYYCLLASRVLIGFLIGATWPAIMPLAAAWIPSTEHSMFISMVTTNSIGVSVSYLLCGFLISSYGWPCAFYVCGGVSLLWSLAWFYLIYDSPEQHPRISIKEKEDIKSNMGMIVEVPRVKFCDFPWKAVFTSGPVWAIISAQACGLLGYITILNEVPLYMHQVLKYDIRTNGILSSLPCWSGYFAGLVFGYLAGYLRKSNKLSTLSIRKLISTIATLGPALMLFIMSVYGDSTLVALISLATALTLSGGMSAGSVANILDISPNFSGTICGIVNSIGGLGIFFSSQLVALLLRNGQTFQEWRHLFWILAIVLTLGAAAFLLLVSDEKQKWESIKNEANREETDMKLVNQNEVC